LRPRRETVEKLVRAFGYPYSLFDLVFDYNFMMRGLIVDKKRGNIIKVCARAGFGVQWGSRVGDGGLGLCLPRPSPADARGVAAGA
jgi:hypothetical protein